MLRKFIIGAACAAVLGVTGLVATVQHSDAQNDVIKERQAAMKSNAAAMRDLAGIMKGEAQYSDEKVDASAATILANLEKAATLFPAGSGEGETRAKPEIWQDMDGFKAALDKAIDGAKAVQASTDEASFKAAFPMLGDSCGGCHEKFRAPPKQ